MKRSLCLLCGGWVGGGKRRLEELMVIGGVRGKQGAQEAVEMEGTGKS